MYLFVDGVCERILGHAFTIMLVYVWSRRNPFVRMNFCKYLKFFELPAYNLASF